MLNFAVNSIIVIFSNEWNWPINVYKSRAKEVTIMEEMQSFL